MLNDPFFGDGYFTSKTLYSKGTGEFRRVDYNADLSLGTRLTPSKYIFHENDYFDLKGNYFVNPDDNLRYYFATFHFKTDNFDGTPIDPSGFFSGACFISEYMLKRGANVQNYNSEFWTESAPNYQKYAQDLINRIIDLNIETFKNVLYCSSSFETVTGIATGDYRNITAENINNPDVYRDLWNKIAELKKNSSYVNLAQRLLNIISNLETPSAGAFLILNRGFKNVEYTNVQDQFQDNLTTFISTVGPLFLDLEWGEFQLPEHTVIVRCEFETGYEELIVNYLEPRLPIAEKNFADSQKLAVDLGGLPVTALTTVVPTLTVTPTPDAVITPESTGTGTGTGTDTGGGTGVSGLPPVNPTPTPAPSPFAPVTPVPSAVTQVTNNKTMIYVVAGALAIVILIKILK